MNNITKYRKLRRMNKTELANQAGLSRQCIHKIEHDISTCTVRTLLLIADVLKVDVKELL